MAQDGVGESSRKVHPFFTKPPPDAPPPSSTTTAHAPVEDAATNADSDTDESRKKRRKTDKVVPIEGSGPKLGKETDRRAPAANESILRMLQPQPLTPDMPTSTPPEKANVPNTSAAPERIPPASVAAPEPAPTALSAVVPPPVPPPTTADAKPPALPSGAPSLSATIPTSMTKVLRFNTRTGTLGSPPKPKRSKENTKIVCIKYGIDEEARKRVGEKITGILQGILRMPEEAQPTSATKQPTQKAKAAPSSSKSTHPFFSGKPRSGAEQNKPAKERNTVFLSSPISPRKQRNPFQSGKAPQFSIKSSGTKIPGAMHPLWPSHGFSHVRGTEARASPACCLVQARPAKKSKGQTVNVSASESVLASITRNVDLESIKHSLPKNNDTFLPPPTQLRVPKRHFESGRKLRRRIRREIRSGLPHGSTPDEESSEDELAQQPPKRSHPAIAAHWISLLKALSAFDRSTCETSSWTTKYAPTSAEQVLQPGKEVILLKQWLEQLRVQSVESAGGDGSDRPKPKSDVARRKKRKSKMDDFVVDTEDENSDMNELSDSSDQSATPNHWAKRKSIVKTRDVRGKDPSRLANTLIISGPHGCGKTAAVYAVAKELDFEIFEISAASRRSGKDILEKVGDMTRNHLVQQHRAGVATPEVDETAEDVKSGKQGTMTSFFKAKPEKKGTGSVSKKQESTAKSSSQKAQKQSLILIEEADILFEDDKQFWATLVGMMSQSKRPFVITCNDESLLPIQTLNLHGIFRFSPAPESLAVDLCLVIAANEGHALKRCAVEALYRSRRCDLRATLADLNYWCQLGVGDRRGGYDWFYLRWPKGIDLDSNGDTVRVISEDTYLSGMGWVCRDPFVSTLKGLEMDCEAAEQAWDYWGLDLADWQRTFDVSPWCKAISSEVANRPRNYELLAAYDAYSTSTSDADICTSGVFAEDIMQTMDATLPEMLEPAKDDFIVGRSLLDADPLVQHFCAKKPLSSSISSLARNVLSQRAKTPALPSRALRPVDESKVTAILDASFKHRPQQLTRYDVAVAFDPIAVSPKAIPSAHLDPSVFDRTMKLITVEVAPWVRGIVGFENRLIQGRQKLSHLLNDGGKRKRMRTTRSAYSALEGGERRSTRKDRYFGDCLSSDAVMYTAGQGWQDCLPAPSERQGDVDDGVSNSQMSVDSGESLGA